MSAERVKALLFVWRGLLGLALLAGGLTGLRAESARPAEVKPAAVEFALDGCELVAPALKTVPEQEALKSFLRQAERLGGKKLTVANGPSPRAARRLCLGTGAQSYGPHWAGEPLKARATGLKPFEHAEAYALELEGESEGRYLRAGGLEPMGTVYALADLERRLRLRAGKLYLSFPEWRPSEQAPEPIFEKPALAVRGEYLNIGCYNFSGITPQDWTRERWHDYIDRLVLARLNRFYFYYWIMDNTLYPGSELSKKPINRKLHEDMREVIDYCHRRGLKVTYMISPAFLPRDVFAQHPKIKAEIEYATWGYPSVCSRAPGAWELMKEVWAGEMKWFAKADAIQIWFYDPGGCWCEKNGCKANQAATLTRQAREFSGLFRELNPQAEVEVNFWPIWLWEDTKKIQYRSDLDKRLRKAFGAEYRQVTAVGAYGNDNMLALGEKTLGFRVSIFIGLANPENAYAFTVPNLTILREVAQTVAAKGLDGAFGHRLEAWTRYPATFFMGEFLWNPALAAPEAVRRYAAWQEADDGTGGQAMAEMITLLDHFTYEGADAKTGRRIQELAGHAYAALPESRKADFEYLPAMAEALAIVGDSVGVKDEAQLRRAGEQFQSALRKSPAFVTLVPRGQNYFTMYRDFLVKGWKRGAF